MFKGLGNMASMLKQAGEMQSKMKEIQANLAQLHVEGVAGGGMVTVEANGQQKILGFKIEQALIDGGDVEMLEDLLVSATNQALDKAKATAAEQMSSLAGGMNIPGLTDALENLGMAEE
ncbi:Nucleoid-associated protein YaaK [hydrothermal vent metagenome]|uniref:Nucleoid-associated protein YaaK n=1 Tax=hydrothermal vent metagenome TaxID=652676 RepID=A0A3B1DR90_9ZZZZ